MAMSMFVTSLETLRRTNTEENPDQTTQQAAADERWADKAELQRFEALFSSSDEGYDEADGDGSQSDVKQGVRSSVLVTVHTANVIVVVRTAATVRRVVDLRTQTGKLLTNDSCKAQYFLIKMLNAFLFCPARATCPVHLILLNFMANNMW
jgi:hypothetical protein